MKLFPIVPLTILASMWSAQAFGQAPAPSLFTYVARGGSGTACTYTAPCGTFNDALNRTVDGGAVHCLTPGYFGPLWIKRGVTIDCAATGASIDAVSISPPSQGSDAAGIYIDLSSGEYSDFRAVKIRGLNLNGTNIGMTIIAADYVSLEDSTIAGVFRGVSDRRSVAGGILFVHNTKIENIIGPGVVVAATSRVAVVLDKVNIVRATYGVAVATGNNVVIRNSVIQGNTTAGVHADGGSQVNILNSSLSHNTVNLNAYGPVRLKENDIQFSNIAIQGSGARSAGANRFLGNVTPGAVPPLLSGAPPDVYD